MWTIVWKLAPYAVAAALALAAVWYLDHRGYERAQHEDQLQQARDDKLRADTRQMIKDEVRDLQDHMRDQADTNAIALREELSRIGSQRTIIQPMLMRELQNAPPRITDPNAGLTIGLRDTVNLARSASGCPSPTIFIPGAGCAMPSGGTDPGALYPGVDPRGHLPRSIVCGLSEAPCLYSLPVQPGPPIHH